MKKYSQKEIRKSWIEFTKNIDEELMRDVALVMKFGEDDVSLSVDRDNQKIDYSDVLIDHFIAFMMVGNGSQKYIMFKGDNLVSYINTILGMGL